MISNYMDGYLAGFALGVLIMVGIHILLGG